MPPVQSAAITESNGAKADTDNDKAEDNGANLKPSTRPGLTPPAPEMNVGYNANIVAILVKLYLFLDGCTHNGLTHLVNVYLVAIIGWTPLDAAWIWFTRDLIKFLTQSWAGGFVDKTKYKKSILSAAAIMKIISGVIMVTTTDMAPQIVKGALDGMITSLVVPVTTAITLGAVGKTKFHRKHAQLNIMVKNLGVSLSAIILGSVAWAIYPNIKNVFYQFIAVGTLCLLCVFIMPPKEAIDHNVARGQSVRAGKDHWRHRTNRSLVSKLGGLEEGDSSDSDSEAEEDDTRGLTVTSTRNKPKDVEENLEDETSENNTSPEEVKEYTNVLSLRDMFGDPTRRTNLIFLALTFFSFHLVNATVLPLLGQYIGTQEKLQDNARGVLPSMAGLIVLKELGSFFTNWFLKSRLHKSVYSTILKLGCGILLLRLILISILLNYTDNIWALGSTNILEGVGIGCLDLVLTLYSHLLSRQTGHYNLNMGIVSTFKTLGSALSVVLGGTLATEANYNVTFPVLTVMVVFPLFFSTRVHTPHLYGDTMK